MDALLNAVSIENVVESTLALCPKKNTIIRKNVTIIVVKKRCFKIYLYTLENALVVECFIRRDVTKTVAMIAGLKEEESMKQV